MYGFVSTAQDIFQGAMVPTAGGGTSVIFNDVETLQQISPGDRFLLLLSACVYKNCMFWPATLYVTAHSYRNAMRYICQLFHLASPNPQLFFKKFDTCQKLHFGPQQLLTLPDGL